jgi:coiled-coil domain-containing protein 55
LDYLRAEEKMIQREREAEGDEFRDKDAFVTQAYKDQMAEVRRAEEEERRREGMYYMATALVAVADIC